MKKDSNSLWRGDVFLTGGELKSKNGKFSAKINQESYLRVYYFNHLLWSTPQAVDRLEVQANGNVIVYDQQNATYITPNTADIGDHLVLDNDAALRVYDSDGNAVWTNGLIKSQYYLNFL